MHTETVLETNDIETVVAARAGDTLGYARVSTNDQNLDAQRARLIEAGAIRVFTDIVSGKRFERPGLAELIDHARPGDRLCVIRLDRLGRSLKELLETVDGLKAHGIHLVSLEERLDTSSAAGELVFHVFGSIAHFERRLISERTRDGIAAANEGRSLNSGDTTSPATTRATACSANEGRSLNSGDTPNRNDWGPFRAIASESSGQITASAVELPIGGAVSQEARRFIGPFTRIFASTGCALWNHRRFANAITGPTACPEHESGTGPSVASPLRFPRGNGTRARNPARGR